MYFHVTGLLMTAFYETPRQTFNWFSVKLILDLDLRKDVPILGV